MNKKNDLTWRELVHTVAPGITDIPNELGKLITLSRQLGIGKAVSFQKTNYSLDEISTMAKIIGWWQMLISNSNLEWRDTATSKKIQETVIRAFMEKRGVFIFSIFCPSYRTGVDQYGYNKAIGSHTKETIRKLAHFVSESEKNGLKTTAIAYFSDLLLENLEKLEGTSYQNDLKSNYASFCHEFLSVSDGKIETPLLSSIPECKAQIGEAGAVVNKLPASNIFKRVLDRNSIFYKEKLGWNDSQIADRTKVIIGSYLELARIFSRKYPEGIMFWAESAYERGLIYSINPNESVPIIYPQKNV